jgi:DNA-binding GntR family transcriptional regulator
MFNTTPEGKDNFQLEPIKDFPVYTPLSEAVYSSVKKSIISGNLQPGQLISENAVAAKLDVSRTPVREAFQRLAIESLVTMLPGRKVIVSIPTIQDIEDVYDIRIILEVEALRRISAKNDRIISQLENCVAQAGRSLDHDDVMGLGQINGEFHQTILSTLENCRLEKFLDSLFDTISRYRVYSLGQEDWPIQSENEHAKILTCIKNGETERAAEILRQHILRAKNILVAKVTQKL